MDRYSNENDFEKGSYFGRILNQAFSGVLKSQIEYLISRYRAFDETGSPAIPYISAWSEKKEEIWYEFVGMRLLKMLNCKPVDAAKVFRDCVLERRIYKNYEIEAGVRKERLSGDELEDCRNRLREEGKSTGSVEAVYKLMLPSGGIVWLKDSARVHIFRADRINVSMGTLAIVSKEMESEEKCERLIRELKSALGRIKTLNGLLPICAHCKKIRDDKGYWNQVEDYLRNHSKAEFSHSICPECAPKLYPDLFEGEETDTELNRLRDDILDIDTFLDNQ